MTQYDYHKYDDNRPNVGVTVTLFIYKDNKLKTLVYRRSKDSEEFADMLALPNRFFERQRFQTAEETAFEALKEKANVSIPYIEQLKTYSGDYIDPNRITTINIGYFALTTEDQVQHLNHPHFETFWCDVDTLINEYDMAFNHKEVLMDAFERICSKAEYTPLACYLLEDKFTIKDFKNLTEYLLGEKLDNSRFRDRIKKTDILVPIEGEYQKGACRPAQLYKFNHNYQGYFYPKSLTKPS